MRSCSVFPFKEARINERIMEYLAPAKEEAGESASREAYDEACEISELEQKIGYTFSDKTSCCWP